MNIKALDFLKAATGNAESAATIEKAAQEAAKAGKSKLEAIGLLSGKLFGPDVFGALSKGAGAVNNPQATKEAAAMELNGGGMGWQAGIIFVGGAWLAWKAWRALRKA